MHEIADLEQVKAVEAQYSENPRLHCVNPRIELTPEARKQEVKKEQQQQMKLALEQQMLSNEAVK